MLIKGTLTQGRTFHVANKIIKEEGVKGLFKGALANVFRYFFLTFFTNIFVFLEQQEEL